MTIKDALVYVSPDGDGEVSLRFAQALAQRFAAEVTGLTFAFEVAEPVSLRTKPDPKKIARLREARRADAEAALEQAKEIFRAGHGKFVGVIEPSHATEAFTRFLEYARLHQLVILPHRSEKSDFERELAQQVLFGSGRPMLLVPGAGKTEFAPERIIVGWDWSRTAARALWDALPLLKLADSVHVVVVADDKDMSVRTDAVEVARRLARHDISVAVELVRRGKSSIGECLFEQAAKLGAGLLVMGGYGHSRMREFVLGGATRTVLAGAPLPVLMSH